MLLGIAPALLLLGNGFGVEWPVPPRGQSSHWFRVDYDPALTDPFFKSNEWSYPWYIIKHPDGHFEDTSTGIRPEKEPLHLKHTARCYSNSHGGGEWHVISFCEARLLDNNIDLFIHDDDPSFLDNLIVRISNGMFACEFSTAYKILSRREPVIVAWTTRQKLTLDKKVYQKGDVIKGRIDFEQIEELTDQNCVQKYVGDPTTIKVFGVFKTIVQ